MRYNSKKSSFICMLFIQYYILLLFLWKKCKILKYDKVLHDAIYKTCLKLYANFVKSQLGKSNNSFIFANCVANKNVANKNWMQARSASVVDQFEAILIQRTFAKIILINIYMHHNRLQKTKSIIKQKLPARKISITSYKHKELQNTLHTISFIFESNKNITIVIN